LSDRQQGEGEVVGEEQWQKATVKEEIRAGRQLFIDYEGGMGQEGKEEEEGEEGLPACIQCSQRITLLPPLP
jgi:hypothetical protein